MKVGIRIYLCLFIFVSALCHNACVRHVSAKEILEQGKDCDLTWSIDSDGLLTIEGNGNYREHAWSNYAEMIKKATVNVKDITDTRFMFESCNQLTCIDLNKLETSNVTDMTGMFDGCEKLEYINMSGFSTDKVTSMECMFRCCSELKKLDLSNFNTKKVTTMSSMFQECTSLTELDISGFDTSQVKDMSDMFWLCGMNNLDVSNFDTKNVCNMEEMFGGCSALVSLDLSNFDTKNVYTMFHMFSGCESLKKINLSKFNTSNVIDMICMFYNCKALTEIDVSGFDTSNVENMHSMFEGCQCLKEIDVSNFKTSKVTCSNGLSYMFKDCYKLEKIDVSGFDIKTYDIESIFENCKCLESLDISNWDLSNVICTSIILGCNSLKTLRLPSQLKYYIYFPNESGYKWLDENDQEWLYGSIGLQTPMLYIKVSKDHVHIWNEGVITTSPSIMSAGVRTYTCVGCGKTKTEVISAIETSHKESDSILKEDNIPSDDNNVLNKQQPEVLRITKGFKITIGDGIYIVASTKSKTTTYLALANSDITSVKVPETVIVNGHRYKVTKIADNAFKNNKKLKKAKIGRNITEIGKNAFKGCKNLRTVNVGKNVRVIGDSAFEGCSSLTSVTIEKDVTKIDKKAFYNCKRLKKIYIKSDKLKSVGSSAFKKINKMYKIKVIDKYMEKYKRLMRGKMGA